jgi:hypothetical protein
MKKSKQKTAKKKGVVKKNIEPDPVIRDLEDLEREELSGSTHGEYSTATSSTDEDEDEGVGDGNIGRSSDDILSR